MDILVSRRILRCAVRLCWLIFAEVVLEAAVESGLNTEAYSVRVLLGLETSASANKPVTAACVCETDITGEGTGS